MDGSAPAPARHLIFERVLILARQRHWQPCPGDGALMKRGPGRSGFLPILSSGRNAMRNLSSGAVRDALALFLALMGVLPSTAADVRKDCQSGRILACTEILQSNPSDITALANRGIGFRASGQYEQAIADLSAAVRLAPRLAGLYLERGLSYQTRGESASAITDFSEASLRLQRPLVQAHFARAMAYEDGQLQLSAADLSDAIRLDRNLVSALYMQRGYGLRTAHQFDKAVSAFDRSIEINAGWNSHTSDEAHPLMTKAISNGLPRITESVSR